MVPARKSRRPAPEPVIHPVVAEPMPRDRMELVEAWGMSTSGMAWVFRPTTADGIREAFACARQHGRTVALRGAGRSYGDASLNREQVVLDLTRMNRILRWDPKEGIATVEPGVTIQRLWEFAIEDGWWPPVVSGTMFTTYGGIAGMNIHGKNCFQVGTIGEHITEFDLLLPTGEVKTCSRTQNTDLFFAAIGGFGQLGVFLSITLKMKKVYSGDLDVYAITTRNIPHMIAEFEAREAESDYMVGWVDCFATGDQLGRGVMHTANYLAPGEDPNPLQSLRVCNQALPDELFGFFPKSVVWRFLKPFVSDWGVRLVNTTKYISSRLPIIAKPHYRQSHAAFAFLLDYVPNWKQTYSPGGLIQYQSFIPAEHAAEVFQRQLRLMHERRLWSYLGVFKKHRQDPFLLTHGVDGYSLALDFPVTRRNRARLWDLCHEFDELTIAAGGRLYFAKDCTMRPGTPQRFLPKENVEAFFALKRACDPESLLSSDQFRRVFGAVPTGAPAAARSEIHAG